MLAFNTSYGYDKISLKIVSKYLLLDKLPLSLQEKSIMIIISDEKDKEVKRHHIKSPNDKKFSVGDLKDGCYYLNVFYNDKESGWYWAYLQNRSVALRINKRRLQFLESPTASENRRVISELSVDEDALKKYLQPSTLSQSNREEIITLARTITRFKIAPMQKLLAIHDWVAENIYYDMDALNSDECNHKQYSAMEVLRDKKCVCRGYANLGVALMRAAGIPAVGLSCYALNISTDGGWERKENQTNIPNHIIAAAYVDKRWIIMDITWDSDNKYEGGKYQNKTGMGSSRKYFDTTLEMISNTHKLIVS